MIPGEIDEERCDKAISPFVYCVFFQTKRKVDRMKPQIGGFPDCLEVGCLQEV